MKRILISLMTLGAVGAVVFAATGAFFSDTETSTGNTLAAGSVDLKIDNTCYYNGQACVEGFWNGVREEGNACSCTWKEKDLEEGDVFFELRDLKPGDWEEDTISMHVIDNDAWACADFTVTTNDDNGCTDPELEVPDPNCDSDSLLDGELARELNFIFWADDGDNVLEDNEENSIITGGPAIQVFGGARWTLADSENSVLEEGPLVGSHTYFIGKAFCYGELTLDPVPADDPQDPRNSPTIDPGIDCDGSGVGNISQTDVLTGDMVFYVEQSRNNPDFLCTPPESPSPSPNPE